MKKIMISDITLNTSIQGKTTFREKLEYVTLLDELKIDGIELPNPAEKEDALLVKTAAEQVKFATLVCNGGQTEESIATTWDCLKNAKKPVLQIALPVSPVQIEYHCHVKPPKLVELAIALVKKCKTLTESVEFKALDAFRADAAFLGELIEELITNGATSIVLSDGVGNLDNEAFSEHLKAIVGNAPSIEKIDLGVETNNELGLGYANVLAAVKNGVNVVKTVAYGKNFAALELTHKLLTSSINAETNIDVTKLHFTVDKIRNYTKAQRSETSAFDFGVKEEIPLSLDKKASSDDVKKAASVLGYDLSNEDMVLIYDQFKRIANKKAFVGSRELEYIIVNSSLQVPQTYRLISYVINSGNMITPTAVVKLEKEGQQLMGISVGDGPVDAGILAIENALGCHYELDDYQITAVTEGREAMGAAIVKLRAGGKLFSGNGLSTDVIGASIRAYVSAINKIAYEEK